MTRRVFLVAAEPSGDALGAELIAALRAKAPDVSFSGIGGPAMEREGVRSAFDIRELSVLGLIDGLKAYPRVVRRAEEATEAAIAASPAAVVLIDSWGFTLRVAQRLRARLPDAPLIKFIGPQVWASRPGRAKTLAATVDHLICIHEFETPFYRQFGLECTVCGHPAFGRLRSGDPVSWRAAAGVAPEAPLLLVLPGSRSSELRRTGPALVAAADLLVSQRPHLAVRMIAARGMEAHAQALAASAQRPITVVPEGETKEDAFAAATAALAASGTVTTEVALQGSPVVVGYKLGWITWALARAFLYKSPFATLMNVAAGREVAPEFIQTRLTPANLAAAAAPLLDDPRRRQAQVDAQNAALDSMGRGGRPAAEIAADAVLSVMDRGAAAIRAQRRSRAT